MPNYHFSYLIGVLIFWAGWLACYIAGKSYRREIRWGSLISAPMAITSPFFIPQYWLPPSLFDLDQKIKVGIEDVLWAAAVGGIASVVGEILLKDRLGKIRKAKRGRHYAPFIVLVVVFAALQIWHRDKTIYNTIIALAVAAIVIALRRSDLIPTMLVGAMSFAVLYFAMFRIVLFLYPEFIQRYYTIKNLLGIYVFGIPIEELLFAAAGGAVWSVAYEYLHGYKLTPAEPI
ncbi:MAG TPA: lycopene cyclase domain-containing protein [Candidatus Acidoferrum sp.]|nr:lycopene cyclase domain-containing protein [Candidatus Acidoferrum sp.]